MISDPDQTSGPQSPIRVGLVQFNIEKHFQQKRGRTKVTDPDTGAVQYRRDQSRIPDSSIYPYSIGLLQAYAQAHCEDAAAFDFSVLLHRRMKVADAVQALRDMDIVGFSSYVWNEQLNLRVAAELKRLDPSKLIVFGGPQVPDGGEAYLQQHVCIDLLCHGEGEATFTEILDRAADRQWGQISGITYRDDEGKPKTSPRGERIQEMASIPSPYLSQTFARLRKQFASHYWVALWETNRGCPFKCSFCDWGSAIASRVYRFDEGRIQQEVAWFGRERVSVLICCDANFGMLARDEAIAEKVVATKRQTHFPFAFAVQNTKNVTDRTYRIQKLLNDNMSTIGVTLSLQSVNPKSLKAIARENISTDAFQDLQARFSQDAIYTYTDVILSLPEEDYESFQDGVETIIQNGQHNHIQFHNLSILPNAEMGAASYQANYGLQLRPQRLLAIHDHIEDVADEEIDEWLNIVVGTETLPAEDWCRAKVFTWMMDFLYFDRINQISFLLLQRLTGLRVVDLVDATLSDDLTDFPLLAKLKQIAFDHAKAIQDGGDEYLPSEAWMGVYWPANHFLRLTVDEGHAFPQLWDELERLATRSLKAKDISIDPSLLAEIFRLNRLLPITHGQETSRSADFQWNVFELYTAAKQSLPVHPRTLPHTVTAETDAANVTDRERYCQYIIGAHSSGKHKYLSEVTIQFPEPTQATSD